MKKQELTQAIEEGVTKGIWYPVIFTVVIFFGCYIFLWGLTSIYSYYHPTQYAMPTEPDVCNYPWLTCAIYEESRYFMCPGIGIVETQHYQENITNATLIIGISANGYNCKESSHGFPIARKEICGYTESNSFFQQFKSNYKGTYKLKMECD